jgi:hypothetical protein
MLLIDDLLFGGLSFVLDKLATVVDQELNDESRLHQTLMEAQMRFELGEIDAEEFAGIERTVIDRLREIRAERDAGAPALTDEGVRISSIEVSGPDSDVDVDMPAFDGETPTPVPSAGPRGTAVAPAVNATGAAGSARRAKSSPARASGARWKPSASSSPAPNGRRRARR